MADFLRSQLDYVFFFYGLAFLILAAVCSGLRGPRATLPWGWLALFGLTHGVNEWLDMLAIGAGDSPAFAASRLGVMVISLVFLFEFARIGVGATGGPALGRWVLLPLVAVAALGGLDGMSGLNAGFRYALALTGGLGSAWALWRKSTAAPEERANLRWVAVAMALYGLAAGLVVPKAGFPPACVLHHDWFIRTIGVPVQLIRGVLACVIAWQVWCWSEALRRAQAPHGRQWHATATAWAIAGLVALGWVATNWMGSHHAAIAPAAVPMERLLGITLTGLACLAVLYMNLVSGGRFRLQMMTTEWTAERAEHEQRLRESEKRYRELVADFPVGLFRSTPGQAGRVLLANLAMAKMHGYDSPESLMRCSPVDLYVDPRERETLFRRLMSEGKVEGVELHRKRLDGSTFYASLSARVVHDGEGLYVEGTMRDVTERRIADEAVKREAAKLSAMLEGMEEGIAFANADGVIVEVNDYLCRFAGISRADILGRSLDQIHSEPVGEKIRQMLPGFRQNAGAPGVAIHRSVGRAEVMMRVQPIYHDGRYDGVLLNVVDVTNLVEARQELEAVNAQLEKAVARANAMATAADTANVAKSEFLANMSHEIRTPLTAILGYSELLVHEELSETDRRAHCQVVLRNGRHLLELVNDILDISKIEADKLVLEHRPISLHSVVADVVSMMRVRAIEKNLTLAVRYTTPLPRTILADEARLRQALVNLVSNAVKFTTGGQVCVTVGMSWPASGEAPTIRVDVSDTGIGIAPEVLGRLFQPFAQADSSTSRKYGGTGLGLAITKRIMDKMGGSVIVRSVPGEGSTFSLLIPPGDLAGVEMVPPTGEAHAAERAAVGQTPGPVQASGLLEGVRVLLAEDGPDNQVLIRTFLTKAGAVVEVVGDGRLAVQAVARQGFDVILMDMQMPEMDGYQATDAIRRLGLKTPVVALTAHALPGDRERCIEAGCDDYLAKPVQRSSLVEIVCRHAGRAVQAQG